MPDRNAGKYSFTPVPTCDNVERCKAMGLCWGAARIKSEMDPSASSCNHVQAQDAREEVKDILDPGRITKP